MALAAIVIYALIQTPSKKNHAMDIIHLIIGLLLSLVSLRAITLIWL
jgi:hypothetical protein